MLNKTVLSIIFPVRVSNNRQYILENIQRIAELIPTRDDIEYVLVDSGSTSFFSREIKNICERTNINYYYQDTRSQIFSIGRARDYGAQVASGECVMFLDVDLVFDSLFFDKIIKEIKSRNMTDNISEYFCVPCFYLSEEASDRFLEECNLKSDIAFRELRNSYDNGESTGIQSFAPATSLLVINRWHLLSIGGHRKEFSGHGSEDFELAHRLSTFARKYHRTFNYYLDKKDYSSIEYEGFRAYFSMSGYSVYNSDLFAIHIWHPRPKDKYQVSTHQNKSMLIDFMKEFDEGKSKIDPLEDLSTNEITLIFGVRKDTAWLSIRQLIPLLGKIDYISEYKIDLNSIDVLIKQRKITRFLFWNPYGNETRLAIYKWAKENKFPFSVFERGALPDSWFIDDGFNADSNSYNYKFWDKELSRTEIIDTEEYINSVIQSGNTLEKNKNFKGESVIKEEFDVQYRIGNRKILFIALQRPSDSVIKYFSGNAQSFDGFIKQVNEVVAKLDPYKWFVIVKKHPLEPSFPKKLQKTENMLLVNDEYHIHDLLSISHKVMLINSGVGVLSMLFRKHVIHFGDAFYSQPTINSHVKNSNEAVKAIESSFSVDEDNIIKFVFYLKNYFYSFAKGKYSTRVEKDGSYRSVLENLEFYQLRGLKGISKDINYREYPVDVRSRIYGFFLPSIIRKLKDDRTSIVSPVDILNSNQQKNIAGTKEKVHTAPIKVKKHQHQPKKQINNEIRDLNDSRKEVELLDKALVSATKNIDVLVRRRNKFVRDPYGFFDGSKIVPINKLKFFYKKYKK